MNWSTQCLDWERRIVSKESLIPTPPLFPEEAARALNVFKQLRIFDIPGQPTMGEASEPWVFEFVAAIFGAYDSENGRRLITEFFLLIAKKNTKSTVAAAVMLTAQILNWRNFAELLILAPTIEVAGNSFDPAKGMIELDPELENMFHVQPHLKSITHRDNGSVFKIVAADKDTVSGKKASFLLIDELWLFGRKPNAENMIREAGGGLASRKEGFKIYLSTQSDEAPAGVFKQKLDYARGVRDGKIKDNCFLPVIYEFPKAMIEAKEHRDPKNFYITNPNLGVSVDVPFLEREYRIAEETGEESMCGFLAKHLNVEIGIAMRLSRWSGADFWEQQACGVTLDYILENSEVIVIGVDGGGLDDMLGFAVIGRQNGTRNWLLWNRAWLYRSALKVRKSEAPKYLDFEKDGDLSLVDLPDTEGIGEEDLKFIEEDYVPSDIKQLVEIVKQCEDSGLLDRIGVDPAGISAIVDQIEEILPLDRIVGVPQGWRMTGSIKTVGLKLATKTLKHGGQPLMSWCVGNARQEQKGNAVSITKQTSGTAKIDPLVATFCAAALMAMNPEARGGVNFYESNLLITNQ